MFNKRKSLLSAVLLLLAAPLAAQDIGARAITSGSGTGDLRIEDAWYGVGTSLCNASGDLGRACDGRAACNVRASNRLCNSGGSGRKALYLTYRCSAGGGESAIVLEGDALDLRCGSGGGGTGGPPPGWRRDRIYIETARYGVPGRTCDVTDDFGNTCDNERRCSLRVDNQLCGDPAPGRRKAANISFWCNGRLEQGRVVEGLAANLSCP